MWTYYRTRTNIRYLQIVVGHTQIEHEIKDEPKKSLTLPYIEPSNPNSNLKARIAEFKKQGLGVGGVGGVGGVVGRAGSRSSSIGAHPRPRVSGGRSGAQLNHAKKLKSTKSYNSIVRGNGSGSGDHVTQTQHLHYHEDEDEEDMIENDNKYAHDNI